VKAHPFRTIRGRAIGSMVSLAVMLVFAFGLLTQFATAASERAT